MKTAIVVAIMLLAFVVPAMAQDEGRELQGYYGIDLWALVVTPTNFFTYEHLYLPGTLTRNELYRACKVVDVGYNADIIEMGETWIYVYSVNGRVRREE